MCLGITQVITDYMEVEQFLCWLWNSKAEKVQSKTTRSQKLEEESFNGSTNEKHMKGGSRKKGEKQHKQQNWMI